VGELELESTYTTSVCIKSAYQLLSTYRSPMTSDCDSMQLTA